MSDAGPSPDDMARLLDEASAGKREALEALLPFVYDELHRLAIAYMRRERPGQTLQATALVHEAYLRLLREKNTRWENRAHFCAIAAGSMRQILVERARARGRLKRAGDQHRITLSDAIAAANPADAVDARAPTSPTSRRAAERSRLPRRRIRRSSRPE